MEQTASIGKQNFFERHSVLLLLLLTNLIFCLLYRKFIFGNGVYLYADVGCDSLTSSYPILSLLARMFGSGDLTAYSLDFGAGADISATYLQYLNPVKFLMIVFGEKNLPLMIMVSTFLQVNLLSLFGFFFFRLLLKNKTAALLSSLAWTFSGYVVLWGQNYSFLTCILLFTVSMYFLQAYLSGLPRKISLLLIPAYSLFLISNYYFFYMTGIFSVFYVIVFMLLKKERASAVIRKLAGLAGAAVFSAAIACLSLLTILNTFRSSTRVAEVTSAGTKNLLMPVTDSQTLLTFLGRLFSVNLFQSGSVYSGSGNYYEMAVLSVSALFLFSLLYLIFRKATRRSTLLLTLLAVLSLLFPLVSKLLIFNAESYRWTFMICFGETAAIGFFLKSLLEDPDREALRKTLIFVPVIATVILGALLLGWKNGDYHFSRSALFFTALLLASYWIILLISRKESRRRFLPVMLTAVLCAEMLLMNNATVSSRIYLTREEFENDYYNDGTSAAVSDVRSADSSLYRIQTERQMGTGYVLPATPDKIYANEGMVGGYASTNLYSSSISGTLSGYGRTYGVTQYSNNFFILDSLKQYILSTLLSGKYVVADSSDGFFTGADSSLFSQAETGVSGKTVLENKNALPFGYLYTKEIPSDTLSGMDSNELLHAVTSAFFYTDGGTGNETSLPEAQASENDSVRLSQLLAGTNDCTVQADGDTLTITPTGSDPYAVFTAPSASESSAYFLELSGEIPEGTSSLYLAFFAADSAYPDFGPGCFRDCTLTQASKDLMLPLPEGLTSFRIDIPDNAGSITLKNACLRLLTSDDFSELASTDISDISFEKSTYRASVVSTADEAMLCIPLPYCSGWSATVNGAAADVRNINGGLCGILLTSGTSEVTMTYHVPHLKTGLAVSLISLLAFAVLYAGSFRRKKTPVV